MRRLYQLFSLLQRTIANIADEASIKQRLIGAGLTRILFGSMTTIFFALHLHQRAFLWGPAGVLTQADNSSVLAQSGSWTIYEFFPSAAGAEFLYWAGLILSVCFTLGIFTSVTKFLFFASTWSVYMRNYYAIDGGENLLIILTIYLLAADLSALSLDREIWRKAPGIWSRHWLAGMLHNAAILACLVQISILYFISAFFKVRGHVWVNGTALYYILRTNEFSLPGWSDVIVRSPVLITLGTYATIFFELMYPWLIWHPRFKYVMTAGAILLHAGIGVFMGLPWFSLTMIGIHVLLFNDSEYLRLASWVRHSSISSRRAMPEPAAALSEQALDTTLV